MRISKALYFLLVICSLGNLRAQTTIGNLVGWVGSEGDAAEVSLFVNGGQQFEVEFFHNGVSVGPGEYGALTHMHSYRFVLNSNTVGTYRLVARTSEGEIVSNDAEVVIRKPSDLQRDFRLVGDDHLHFSDRPALPAYAQTTQVSDGVITISFEGKIYKWGSTPELIFETSQPIPGFSNDWQFNLFGGYSLGQDGILDFTIASGTNRAIIEKSASGFRTLARIGDPIPGRPEIKISQLGRPMRAKGKVAFAVYGDDFGPNPYAPPGYRAIWIDRGAGVQTLIDTADPNFAEFEGMNLFPPQPESGVAFDGDAFVFITGSSITLKGVVVSVTMDGAVGQIATDDDPIPGTPYSVKRLPNMGIARSNGKTYFFAAADGEMRQMLLEHDPARATALRLVFHAGTTIPSGLTLSKLLPGHASLSDGSVLFTAIVGGFTPQNAATFDYCFGIFRERNGQITEEVLALDRFAGQRLSYTAIVGSSGTNYVFNAGGATWTTAQGPARPANTKLQLQQNGAQLTANWTGYGRLQSTTNFINWTNLQTTQGVLTNEPSSPARFYRIYHP